uniref:Transmembrane protein n=1 Tax=Plectus sambesii TaxID=2011161 RepID=A0A914V875_9BILA
MEEDGSGADTFFQHTATVAYDDDAGSGADTFLPHEATAAYDAASKSGFISSRSPAYAWLIGSGVFTGLLFGIGLCFIVFFVRHIGRRRARQGTYRPGEVEVRTNRRMVTSSPSPYMSAFSDKLM